MGRKFTAELRPGDRVDATFALTAKEMRAARTGEAYLSLELRDRTGRIPGIMFRPGREAEAVPVGVVVRTRGIVTEYRGVARVSVDSLTVADRYEPREILPTGTRDERELMAELRSLIASVKRPALAALLRAVFGDVGMMRRFRVWPATVDGHHSYLGGLLEHTVGVASMCAHLTEAISHADADLLLTGALLHDVGVVDAIDIGAGLHASDEGRLLGHSWLTIRRVESVLAALKTGVDGDDRAGLLHMIGAHDDREAGEGLRPQTIEALVLAHADHVDSDIARFLDVTGRARIVGERWTDADNRFGRHLRVPEGEGLRAGEGPRAGAVA